jgi:tRNA-uridine 2-sulfurtransferase
MEKKESVVILFSGGMRSAIAAYLLKQQGYKVTGLGINFSKLSHKKDPTNCFPINLEQASKLAKKIDIDFFAVKADAIYDYYVLDPMVSARMVGQSFDPMLNATGVLFDLLMEKSRKLNADRMASGHRCKIRYNKVTDEYYLEQYKNMPSGQTQNLFMLTQDHLSSLFFPLSDISTEKLIQIAHVAGIDQDTRESIHGLSFMQNEELQDFYIKRIPLSMRSEGDIIDSYLDVTVGTHQGLCYYHLGMSKIVDKNAVKLDRNYSVSAFDHAKSILYVKNPLETPKYKSCSIIKFHSYLNIDESRPLKGLASIQGQEELIEGMIFYKNNGYAHFEFTQPYQALLNSGLSIALYEKQTESLLLLGGGQISVNEDNLVEKEVDSASLSSPSETPKKKNYPSLSF